jgi:hypothetical protein
VTIPNKRNAPRFGWDVAAARMHERGDDELLIPDVFADEAESICDLQPTESAAV